MLAEMYLYDTKYVVKDESRALHWHEKAARLGATEAQHQTAAMYAQGTGTKIDNKQAWMWLTIAGNNNPWVEKGALRCLVSGQDIWDAEQTAANCKRLLRIQLTQGKPSGYRENQTIVVMIKSRPDLTSHLQPP